MPRHGVRYIPLVTDEQDQQALEALTPDEIEALDEAEPHASQVVYSGQDFDIDGLVRRLRNGDIVVPQFGHSDATIETYGFQRGFVWTRSQMDRFIESLLLGFPIPGVFFVRQRDRKYLVLDGQQRLKTLQAFYDGVHGGREFALKNVSDQFKDLTYKALPAELRRTLDNAFIQATVVDTDGSEESLNSVYQIFERLNAGGTQLTPHEIRIALYAGQLVDLIANLNKSLSWRTLYGSTPARLRDQELVLRILALYVGSETYTRPLKVFLNNFARENRDATSDQLLVAADRFKDASEAILAGPGPDALRKSSRQVNAAQTEALFVGLMRRLESGAVDLSALTLAVNELRDNPDFSDATTRATADEEPVATRLRLATEAFHRIP